MTSSASKKSERAPIFWLHIDHIDNADGRVWAVRQGRRYYVTRKVWLNVPLAETVYRKRPQPRAYIRGEGYVQVNDDGSISIN
jgi:hypothetical protein